MRCLECSGFFVSKRGDLAMSDDILGDFIVPDVEYELCEGCGEQMFSPATLEAIENVEEERKNKLLLQKPLGEFIPATKVAEILGCTRQAVHKHNRIRRGFIHFVKFNGQYYYHKKSVEMYKDTGDGRFSLSESKSEPIFKNVWKKYRDWTQLHETARQAIDQYKKINPRVISGDLGKDTVFQVAYFPPSNSPTNWEITSGTKSCIQDLKKITSEKDLLSYCGDNSMN
jgi:hypothetical protein